MLNYRVITTTFLVMLWIILYVIERILVNKIRENRGQSAVKGTLLFFILNNWWHEGRNYMPKHSQPDCLFFDFWNRGLGEVKKIGVYLAQKVEQFDFWLEKKIRSYDAWKLGKELEK